MNVEKIQLNPNRATCVKTCSKKKRGIICDVHLHPELEFLYITSGKLRCYNEQCDVVGSKNEIIFINSNIPHATENLTDNASQILVQFSSPSLLNDDFKYLSAFWQRTPVSMYVFKTSDPQYSELLDCIKDMYQKNNEKNITNDYYVISDMHIITALLYKKGFIKAEEINIDKNTFLTLKPIFEYVLSNYKEKLSLDFFASQLNLNKSYICRLFKKTTGYTIMDYINFIRIHHAQELLKTDMTISDICYEVGFSSLSYFNRVFKKYKQHSPSYYKGIYTNKKTIS